MLTDHRSRLVNILDIIGNKPIVTITRDDLRFFRKTLEELPPRRKNNKLYADKSINEIIKINKLNNGTTLSIRTVNEILHAVSTMFEWARKEGLLTSNPAKGLSKKDERPEIDIKEPFTNQEIKMLFYSGDFTIDTFENPAYYWAPLISLYSGMRLEEISQLHCADIYQDSEGIWIFDINIDNSTENDAKKLKNKNAKRKIPIHPELIRLGILEYKDSVSENIRLFPLLNVTKKTKKYGKQVGKMFSSWIKKKGIPGKKSFHSLRHTFADFYKKNGLQNDLFTQIFGHELQGLAKQRYGSRFTPKQCYDEIIYKLTYC